EVNMKKGLLIVGILLIGLIVVGFTFEKETKPKDDTRLILEHTYKTYIAPPCFEDADATNYLEDSDIEMAKQLEYEPNDTCTEETISLKLSLRTFVYSTTFNKSLNVSVFFLMK